MRRFLNARRPLQGQVPIALPTCSVSETATLIGITPSSGNARLDIQISRNGHDRSGIAPDIGYRSLKIAASEDRCDVNHGTPSYKSTSVLIRASGYHVWSPDFTDDQNGETSTREQT
jgi:hypothetical protein